MIQDQGKGPWHLIFIGLVATSLLALALACGGAYDGPDEPGTGENGGGADGSASDSLRDLAERARLVVARVTYEMSSPGAGDTTVTIYSRPPASRLDITADGETTTVIDTEAASYICVEGQCLESDPGGADATQFLTGLINPEDVDEAISDLPQGTSVEEFDDEVAGEAVQCFKAEGAVIEGQGEEESTFCFANDGLLLRAAFVDDSGETLIEATDFSRNLSADDFEPPYDVIDLGELGR